MAYANDPAFSPDGGSIVFRSAMQRSKRDTGFSEELYILRMDASLPPRRLTHYPEHDYDGGRVAIPCRAAFLAAGRRHYYVDLRTGKHQ